MYEPANNNERYCHLKIQYNIADYKVIHIYYSKNSVMVCDYRDTPRLLCQDTMFEILHDMLMEYTNY